MNLGMIVNIAASAQTIPSIGQAAGASHATCRGSPEERATSTLKQLRRGARARRRAGARQHGEAPCRGVPGRH
eukprot:9771741-Lingulodinium_polyedra.AAC.1